MPGGGAGPAPTHVKDWAPAPEAVGLAVGQLATQRWPCPRIAPVPCGLSSSWAPPPTVL